MVISTNLGSLGFYYINRFLFPEEKDTLKLRAFSGMQLIPSIKSADHYITVGVISLLCLQRGS